VRQSIESVTHRVFSSLRNYIIIAPPHRIGDQSLGEDGVSCWIHGRDLPGYPASHGCVGLYDEPMQKEQYGIPKAPEVNDAKRLFEWVLGGEAEDVRMISIARGPRVHIIGQAPGYHPSPIAATGVFRLSSLPDRRINLEQGVYDCKPRPSLLYALSSRNSS
jgi:hypothetical protein